MLGRLSRFEAARSVVAVGPRAGLREAAAGAGTGLAAGAAGVTCAGSDRHGRRLSRAQQDEGESEQQVLGPKHERPPERAAGEADRPRLGAGRKRRLAWPTDACRAAGAGRPDSTPSQAELATPTLRLMGGLSTTANSVFFVIEVVGTIAFAVSGVMAAASSRHGLAGSHRPGPRGRRRRRHHPRRAHRASARQLDRRDLAGGRGHRGGRFGAGDPASYGRTRT